ncbi:MAG TPA: DUF6805 domain-containing protein, partial [Verrucomicrobiae bacterium]|nr:DUF6805 domain-containing protein [Verrucomicrobiae bacterium]
MSEFKFLCPECGQKILGDTAYINTQIGCPTCRKTITVHAAPSVASAPVEVAASPGGATAAPVSRTAPRPPQPPSSTAARNRTSGRFSALAAASLICSVVVPLGSIPGIICGHMAKAKMRRNILLEGKKMANAGLLISYCVLMAMLGVAGVFTAEHWLHHPVKVLRDSPEAVAALQSRVVDEVIIGQNEQDHDLGGMLISQGVNRGKQYRSATHGGSFSYMMRVLPDQAMTLNCRYWGTERRGHVFDIAVDDQIIATQNLTGVEPGHFFDMEYKIPAGLT